MLTLAGQKAFAAFVEPTNQPPENNTYEFLRIDGENQAKRGKLRLGSDSTAPINYQLEVLGEGAIINEAVVDNNVRVDTTSNTLFIDATNNRVCVGICLTASAPYNNKLEVSGGSMSANGGSVTGISIVSSAATREAIYGQGATTAGVQGVASGNNAGVLGWAQGVAITGSSTSGNQVSGYSTQGAGIYGATTNSSGLWAGYFSGRLESGSDVSGAKFIPTALGSSLVPYTIGQITSEYAYTNANPVYFDGTYVWTISNNKLYKIRASDGFNMLEVTLGYNPTGVAFDGTDIWVTMAYEDSTPDAVLKLNSLTGSNSGLCQTALTADDNPRSIAYDGKYIWVATSGSKKVFKILGTNCSLQGTWTLDYPIMKIVFDGTYIWGMTNNGHIYKINPSEAAVVDFSYFVGTEPKNIVYDNSYFWVTTQSVDVGGRVTKLYVDAAGNLQVFGTYAVGSNPAFAVFDGAWLWVGNVDSQTVTRISAADPRQSGICSGSPSKCVLSGKSCSADIDCLAEHRVDVTLGFNPTGMLFDGTHIWIGSNGTTLKKYYSGRGWGMVDLRGALTLQNNSTLIQQSGSISIDGSGRIGGDMTASGDVSVPNNIWGGTADSVVSVSLNGSENCSGVQNCFNCPPGEYVKNIIRDGSDVITGLECRPL